MALTLVIASIGSLPAQAQRQSAPSIAHRRAPQTQSLLTGVYRLDVEGSDDPRVVAERAAGSLPTTEQQQRATEELTNRLTAPALLSIERRGRTIDIASSRAPRISFEADGLEHSEQASDGHTVRTRAVLYGDQLMVSSQGSPRDDFSVTFDPVDNGRRLRVTRRIHSAQLNQPLVIQSIYDKSSDVARWDIFGEQQPSQTASATNTQPVNTQPAPPVDNRDSYPQPFPQEDNDVSSVPQPSPPVIRERPAQTQAPSEGGSVNDFPAVPNDTQLVAVLNNSLSTGESREGERFTMTVRTPGAYEGATIEGHVSNVKRAGRISGRSEMRLNFDRIVLRDGRAAGFAGYIEGVRTVGGENVRVEPESGGGVQERDNRSNRTAQRAAIGAAVGAIIGAIAAGGRGAAIGAAIGAGAGAGSVYAEGRDDLDLRNGTEFTIRANATR
jgi:hypothetical protein